MPGTATMRHKLLVCTQQQSVQAGPCNACSATSAAAGALRGLPGNPRAAPRAPYRPLPPASALLRARGSCSAAGARPAVPAPRGARAQRARRGLCAARPTGAAAPAQVGANCPAVARPWRGACRAEAVCWASGGPLAAAALRTRRPSRQHVHLCCDRLPVGLQFAGGLPTVLPGCAPLLGGAPCLRCCSCKRIGGTGIVPAAAIGAHAPPRAASWSRWSWTSAATTRLSWRPLAATCRASHAWSWQAGLLPR